MLPTRLQTAYQTTKAALLAERVDGHWIGELSTSALSTATAVSALALPGNDAVKLVQPLVVALAEGDGHGVRRLACL